MTRFLCWLFPTRAVTNMVRVYNLLDKGEHRTLLLELDRMVILPPQAREEASRYLRLRYGLEDK